MHTVPQLANNFPRKMFSLEPAGWIPAILVWHMAGGAAYSAVNVAPAPAGEELSSRYSVKVDDQAVAGLRGQGGARRSGTALEGDGRQDPLGRVLRYGGLRIVRHDRARRGDRDLREPIAAAKILPSRMKITPSIAGKSLTFALREPRPVTIEINGNWVGALHVFANPAEAAAPRPDDPNVIYFGPGVHRIAQPKVGDSKTVYLAAGAVVKGTAEGHGPVFSLVGKHIVLRGRGILDGGLCPTHSRNLLLVRGQDITVEGIVLRDSSTWTIPIRQSDRVTVRNVKLLGYRANSDGIDVCNSRDVRIEGCFIRTLDDLIVVKTDKGQGEARRIVANGCVSVERGGPRLERRRGTPRDRRRRALYRLRRDPRQGTGMDAAGLPLRFRPRLATSVSRTSASRNRHG